MIINPYLSNNYHSSQTDLSGTAISGLRGPDGTGSQTSGHTHILNGGDTVAGEVLSKSGGNVTLSLGDGNIVSAKLDISADIQVGTSILFNVKSSDSNGLVLSPLFTNMNTENPVTKALNAAGLVINDKNLMMVNSMMQEGMNVGKSELANMSGLLEHISAMDISDAVMLHKLGIEINQDNIEQFGLYKNYEHQISGAVNEIMDLVTDSLSDMVSENESTQAIEFAKDLLDIFTSNGAIIEDNSESGMINLPVSELLSSEELNELVHMLQENGIPDEFGEAVLNGDVSLKELMYVLDDLIKATPVEEGQIDNIISESVTEETANESSVRDNVGLDFLKALATNTNNKSVNVDNNDISNNTTSVSNSDNNGDLAKTSQEVKLQVMGKLDYTSPEFTADRDKIVSLISSKTFGTILKSAINAEWKLLPAQVGEEKQVSNLYKRITEQTGRLLDSVNSRAGEDTPLAEKSAELNKNINFMNELNNMFNYVQLPMRMAGNDAHGELYVYSNKKHMASEDGTVSALLHLDMDHLGPTDVYVTMNQSNHVNTHFYLRDDYSLDLIAEHIDELNARLEKRGYNLDAEFSKRDEMSSIMSEIVEENKNNVPVSISSFDARA